MPSFGARSLACRQTLDYRLREILDEAIKHYDFSILCGHRGEHDQHEAFLAGKSKVDWPNSKHNTLPSQAADVAPYPIDWSDKWRFVLLAGAFLEIARQKGFNLRWGGDWDQDGRTTDERFQGDIGHFEIMEKV